MRPSTGSGRPEHAEGRNAECRTGSARLEARRSALGARQRGFTLIEILIVITIIGILVTLAQPSYNRALTAAKEATLKENLFILRDRIDQFYADNGKYPASLNDLVDKPYLRRIPKDPMTGSADTWTVVYQTVTTTDQQGQSSEGGVFDIKSSSDRIALDGTRYSDW